MANGIGRVWAANAGDDEQRPNGVGSVWIENIDSLAPSGGASEQQINELSAAIDYVSANAGDPNALTGYQNAGEISSTSSLFVARGDAGYLISTDPGKIDVSGNYFNLHVGEGGHFSANNLCSAVFTNGSKFIDTNNGFISADGSYGFYTSGDTNRPAVLSVDSSKGFYTSANGGDLFVRNGGHLSAIEGASAIFTNGSLISADGWGGFLASGTGYNISSNSTGFEVSASQYAQNLKMRQGELIYSAGTVTSILNYNGLQISGYQGLSAGFGNFNGTALYSKIGPMIFNVNTTGIGWSNSQINNTASIGGWQGNGIGYSGMGSKFEVCNGSTASISNGGTLEVHQGAVISADIGGHLKAVNGASAFLDGGKTTYIFGGNGLIASASQFISADGEGVSAWKQAPIIALGQYNQTSSNAAFVVGNGSGVNARSDLFVIDYSGNAQTNDFIAGNGAKLSDLTSMANKINELEQILQTYSGQWLIGG